MTLHMRFGFLNLYILQCAGRRVNGKLPLFVLVIWYEIAQWVIGYFGINCMENMETIYFDRNMKVPQALQDVSIKTGIKILHSSSVYFPVTY